MHVSSRGIFQSGQDEKYDAKRQRNRHSQSPVVPGANLKIGEQSLIFQRLMPFLVSHFSEMPPVRLPNFKGGKRETSVLQHILHLVGDDLHGHLLHLGTVLNVAECRIIVGVSCTRHDVIRRCL